MDGGQPFRAGDLDLSGLVGRRGVQVGTAPRAATVPVAPPPRTTIKGALTPEAVASVFTDLDAAVAACRAEHAPDATGVVRLKIVVERNGRVNSARPIADSVGSAPLSACVAAAVGGARFPKTDNAGIAVIEHGVVFD